MTAPGYKRSRQPLTNNVRSTPNSRHSLADVRYRADYVRFAPENGRSKSDVPFGANDVR